MERAHVRVKNAAGQDFGSFDDPVSFRTWKREIQKKLGAKLAVAVGDGEIIDCPALLSGLPWGEHDGVLVQQAPIPPSLRRRLKGMDMWKAI